MINDSNNTQKTALFAEELVIKETVILSESIMDPGNKTGKYNN